MGSRPRIAVIDYQGGNLQSVVRSFDPKRFDAFITSNPDAIRSADGLVLPGVGAFADAMRYMDASGQTEALKDAVVQGTPLLGICLGMQVLFERGEEGMPSGEYCQGLGLLEGECARLEDEVAKVPHVGWNTVEYCDNGSPLFKRIPNQSYFYFTHSYCVRPANEGDMYATTADIAPMISAVERAPIFGVQFHPEKSSTVGLILMENFANVVGATKETRS